MDGNCIFCKIINGDVPSYKVGETDKYLAFLDIFPFSDGHTLVVPKKHFDTVWEYEDISEYFKYVGEIRSLLREKLELDYVDMVIMGRGVNHAHVHLIPYGGVWEKMLKDNELSGKGAIHEELAFSLLEKIKAK